VEAGRVLEHPQHGARGPQVAEFRVPTIMSFFFLIFKILFKQLEKEVVYYVLDL